MPLRYRPGTDVTMEQTLQFSNLVLSVSQQNDLGRVMAVLNAKFPSKRLAIHVTFALKIRENIKFILLINVS